MKINSSMISEIFDWTEVNGQGQFDVKFPNGRIYRYFNVPRGIYDKLLNAPSIGRFFDIFIRKAGYRYEEILATQNTEIDDLADRIVQACCDSLTRIDPTTTALADATAKVTALLQNYLAERMNKG